MGDLTKELMKRSHIARAHSTTYRSQTNGLVERQNRTLVNMLRVYCSRYMTDWDKYLLQVVRAYNSTQHSTTGISPFMMLTGKERAMPLTFFYILNYLSYFFSNYAIIIHFLLTFRKFGKTYETLRLLPCMRSACFSYFVLI